MSIPLDTYTLIARAGPAAVVSSPLLAFAALSLPLDPKNGALALLFFVGVLVFSQLARDAGKRIEPGLWRQWGGALTSRRPRFANSSSPEAVAGRHTALEALLGLRLPDRAAESADPRAADRAYEGAVMQLRELTRDRARFSLVFWENVNYGFRRNLLGLREWGIGFALVGIATAGAVAALLSGGLEDRILACAFPAGVSVASLCLFGFLVEEGWVRAAAEEYAERLFGALVLLAQEASGPRSDASARVPGSRSEE